MIVRFLNLFLRLTNSACKFGAIFLISRYISLEAAGQYSIIMATIVLGIYLLGLDFYTYTNREVLAKKVDINFAISNHFTLLMTVFFLFLPIFILSPTSFFGDLSKVLIVAIIISELIGMELSRYLIVLKKPLKASFSIFARFALWFLPLSALLIFDDINILLEDFFILWLVFNFASLVVTSIYLKLNFSVKSLDFGWIKKGILISFIFFLGSIFLRLLLNIDRYYIESLLGYEELAVYGAYISIAAGITVFVDSLVLSFTYPFLVEMISEKNSKYKDHKIKMIKNVFIVCIVCMVGIWLIFPVLSELFGSKLFYERSDTLIILVLAFIVLNISQVYYYVLYAMRKEKIISLMNLLGLSVFLIQISFLNRPESIFDVSIIVSISIIFIAIGRFVMSLKYEKLNYG